MQANTSSCTTSANCKLYPTESIKALLPQPFPPTFIGELALPDADAVQLCGVVTRKGEADMLPPGSSFASAAEPKVSCRFMPFKSMYVE